MSPRRWMAAVILATALFVPSTRLLAEDVPASAPSFEGRWVQQGDPKTVITITPLARGVYGVIADQWEGVGLFDGKVNWGVFLYGEKASPPELARASGTHKAILRPDGSLAVHGEYADAYSEAYDVTWTREPQAARTGRFPKYEQPAWPREARPGSDSGYPRLGDFVYVDELPEAITKVPPSYPDKAREARIQGLVVVQALVGEDGKVKDTQVTQSIPGLDDAAIACVRKWVYKPATAKGKPVAVWVAVPVNFVLH